MTVAVEMAQVEEELECAPQISKLHDIHTCAMCWFMYTDMCHVLVYVYRHVSCAGVCVSGGTERVTPSIEGV